MDGILNFDKPLGWTSHDAVAHVRRTIRQKRVGHAGTLDPLATGVLLICIGQATRVSEYLMASDKTYLAHIRLGVTTDTYDSEGQVVDTQPVSVTPALQTVLQQFVGEIEQVPPMYSALKHKGERLYKLARRGIQVERAARQVRISTITLHHANLPDFAIEVQCSSGTYIRSLAHDIGQALGCGAHLTGLVRQASGAFHVDQAITPARLEVAIAEEHLSELLHPIDAALQDLPAFTLDAELAQRVQHGQFIKLPINLQSSATICRAYDETGQLIAVMIYRDSQDMWQPDKVFRET